VTGAIGVAGLLVTVAGFASGAATLVATRRLLTALSVLLDMLLAASLLRLAVAPTWAQLGGTALLVLVKRLASAGLRRATVERARRSSR
jgi:hypothetical protein